MSVDQRRRANFRKIWILRLNGHWMAGWLEDLQLKIFLVLEFQLNRVDAFSRFAPGDVLRHNSDGDGNKLLYLKKVQRPRTYPKKFNFFSVNKTDTIVWHKKWVPWVTLFFQSPKTYIPKFLTQEKSPQNSQPKKFLDTKMGSHISVTNIPMYSPGGFAR